VAGHTSLAKGFDSAYPMKAVGKNEAGHSYYLSPTQQGEPHGRWFGKGAEALGLAPGSKVEELPYKRLVTYRTDPRDGTTQLGRAPGKGLERARALYLEYLAAEPHATNARKRVLGRKAQREARQGPLYFDLTFSMSKSISVFYASMGENLRLATERGDTKSAARWAAELAEFDEMLNAANQDMLRYFEREAGYTRTGYHGGRGTGQYREAELAFATFLQHTSRDDDIQLHFHNVVAHVARTVLDDKHRAPDSRGYGDAAVGAAAFGVLSLESRISERWGVTWRPRADGYGAEIDGVTQPVMDALSSRRFSIEPKKRELVAEFENEYGRKPTQSELHDLAQDAWQQTRQGKEGLVDLPRLQAMWSQRIRDKAGVALDKIAPSVTGHARGRRQRPTDVQLWMAQAEAVEKLQERKSSWTRQELIQQLHWSLPAEARNIPAAELPDLLERLTDQILAGGGFRDVVCLEAPEVVSIPADLIRSDGRSVYKRHSGTRYATAMQLTTEERMVAQAQAQLAPLAERERVAQLLGSDADTLEEELRVRAVDAREHSTATGLRLDQAAAVYQALTSQRRVTVLTGAAGTGKTYSLAALTRAAREAGAPQVWGITTSQAARNVLSAAGKRAGVRMQAFNSSQFLGDIPGRRGARQIMEVARGSLIVIDEASMMSSDHLARIIAYVAERDCRVVVAGDQEQLAAVELGGGMRLLARKLGFVQLAEAQRFEAGWERAASFALRRGDESVLEEYRVHGRIHGGHAEQVMEDAVAAAVARMVSGHSVLLIAAEREMCRELGRWVHDELVKLNRVSGEASGEISAGARASQGDLVICRANDHQQGVANGDMFRVAQVTDGKLVLESEEGGEIPFTPGQPGTYDLAYGQTAHTSQGRTVDYGIPVVTGSENRQALYVMMSRGAKGNDAYVICESARVADPEPGTRPAPEIGRYDRQHGAEPAPEIASDEDAEPKWSREPEAVLADVLARDGAELSALEMREQNAAEADNLGYLHGMFSDQVTPLRQERYRKILTAELPEGFAVESYQARWLFRTMETCERAELNATAVVRSAIAERSLGGARDVASVVDARIRRAHPNAVPVPPPDFADQVPQTDDAELERFLTELAQAMDARKDRLGQFAAVAQPEWATEALGAVPADPVARLDWERRASDIWAYRELFGYESQSDPVGPEPTADSPVKRAYWTAAFAALGDVDDVRGLPDGLLVSRQAMYETQTAWSPRFVREELGQVRASAQDRELDAIRHDAEAEVARQRGDQDKAGQHELLAGSSRSAAMFYRSHEAELAQGDEDYREWESLTEASRHMAVAADSELRRRAPGRELPPLKSAEPDAVSDEERAELDRLPEPVEEYEAPGWLAEMAERRREFRDRADEHRGMEAPAEDHELEGEQAWPTLLPRDREAVLQPPAPVIPRAEPLAEREPEREGAAE
jgi:DNA replication protein DnaC